MPSIPAQSIEAIRLTCKHCGVALVLPVAIRDVPFKCFNCANKFPAPELQEFMRDLRDLQKEIKRSDVTFLLHLEQVQ